MEAQEQSGPIDLQAHVEDLLRTYLEENLEEKGETLQEDMGTIRLSNGSEMQQTLVVWPWAEGLPKIDVVLTVQQRSFIYSIEFLRNRDSRSDETLIACPDFWEVNLPSCSVSQANDIGPRLISSIAGPAISLLNTKRKSPLIPLLIFDHQDIITERIHF